MKLGIVIPAYNEEQAIASIIERTLAARQHIIARSPVDAVEVIVVSDGSTDRTADIARGYTGIRLIEFPANRGYGAAIKSGFDATDAEWVGFLDADGTCDPNFFADLGRALADQPAAIALGSRLGPHSEMPRIRRIGNRMYAAMLSILTNRVVHDTASGMRVIRRQALQRLYPLPDGLHFTPAMSARALLDDQLPVAEVPMAYRERIGESKLDVLRDGWRFCQTIMEMTLYCRPARLLLSAAIICALVTIILAAHPVEMWLRERRLDESMIYRLLFCSFLGSLATMCVAALGVTDALRGFDRESRGPDTLVSRAVELAFSARGIITASVLLLPVIAVLIGPGVYTWLIERQVHIHWSRVVLAGLLAFVLCQMCVTRILVSAVKLHVSRYRFTQRRGRTAATRPPAPVRPPHRSRPTPTVAVTS